MPPPRRPLNTGQFAGNAQRICKKEEKFSSRVQAAGSFRRFNTVSEAIKLAFCGTLSKKLKVKNLSCVNVRIRKIVKPFVSYELPGDQLALVSTLNQLSLSYHQQMQEKKPQFPNQSKILTVTKGQDASLLVGKKIKILWSETVKQIIFIAPPPKAY